ncbi:MAG: helix-turn-helix domain-containing protein [Anaerolineae bacterium]|nr:helix-turn-helix domain-containing protein [Anaerolineae bacterium]
MSKHHTERPPILPTRVYSRAEAAEILDVSLSTVKRLLASGELRASQPVGLRRVFITGQAILDMLDCSEMQSGIQATGTVEQPDQDQETESG